MLKRLFLAIPFLAAIGSDKAYCQVEYQQFDGFTVLSEPSPMPTAKSKEPSFLEDVLILRDTNPKEKPADIQTCQFLDANTSLTWQTADSATTLYVYRNCGRSVEMVYRDLSGREWKQSQLIPLQRETLFKTLAKFDGSDGVEPGEDAQARIAAYAICKGVVPKPDWFHDICDQQRQKAAR